MSDAVSVRKRDVVCLYLTREADRAQNSLPRPDPLPATASQKFPKTCSYDTPGRAAVYPRYDFVGSRDVVQWRHKLSIYGIKFTNNDCKLQIRSR